MTRVRFLVIGVIAASAALAAAQNPAAPILEVDHTFILTAPMAKEERAAVEAAGLTIGQHVAKHTGAGTASTAPEKLSIEAEEDRAPWLRPGTSILSVRDVPGFPMLFVVPRYVALDACVAKARETEPESFRHKAGLERLTRVIVSGPYQAAPDAVANMAELQFVNSPDHRLELTFDEGRQGKRADLRPTLPLVLAF